MLLILKYTQANLLLKCRTCSNWHSLRLIIVQRCIVTISTRNAVYHSEGTALSQVLIKSTFDKKDISLWYVIKVKKYLYKTPYACSKCAAIFKNSRELIEYWLDNPLVKQAGGGQDQYTFGRGIRCEVILYSISGLRCLAVATKEVVLILA